MLDTLSNLLTHETGADALAVLLDSGAKGLALLALAAGGTFALRRVSAASRHLVWTLAMGGLLLLPALSVVVPKWQLPLLPSRLGMRPTPSLLRTMPEVPWTESMAPDPMSMPPAASTPNSLEAEPETALQMPPPEAETASASVQPSAPLASPVPPRLPVAFWALAAWGTVAGAILLPLLAGLVAVARLVRAARPFADPEWADRLRALSAALGVEHPVRLLCAGPGAMPMAVGLLRPAILLPRETDTWPEEKRRAVLLHELAHVARRDCLTHALARVALALHWFNPLAWVALRQMRIERERACDDRVLTAGERASAYADHLLDIARTMHADALASVAAITMAKRSQLEGRLLAVLDPKQSRYALTRWAVIAAIVGATALLLPLAATKVTSAPPVADTPAAIWDQAKPVLPTQRLFDRGSRWIPRWMQQPQPPFRLDPSDPVETCAAIAQRGNTPQPTGGTQFETDKTRQELEDILRQRPDYFYAEYLLGTWHRLKGNQTIADDWYRRAFRHAPAIFVQPYTQADGTPAERGQIVRNFVLACYHQEGGELSPQELWYPLAETDERGAIYLPAYPTVVMTNALRSGLRSVSAHMDPTIYRPASKGDRNNLVRYFVDFPGRDYFESEGRIGLLPAAVVQKTGSGSYNSSGKMNPTFSEISTISPADFASLPETAQPPQLRMISNWTSEKQTPDSLVAWKPDGRPVDNPDEQQVLANYPSMTDSAEPPTHPVVLGFWIQHPLFDNHSDFYFLFYDSAHKSVDSLGGGLNNDPETHKRFPGWRCTKDVFESTQLPDRGQVELRYSLGPWTYFPTTISPTHTGEVPGEPVTIHSIKSAGANATEVSFTVLIPNAGNARQCEMVALTDRDSTATVELEPREHGFQLLPDNTGGRYSFHFEAPLEKIKGFRVRHRPIQRHLYDNVVFRRTAETPPPAPEKPQDGIQIRFVGSESNVSPDSGTSETVYTWRIDTTETLQVPYLCILLREDGSFGGKWGEGVNEAGDSGPVDLFVRFLQKEGKLETTIGKKDLSGSVEKFSNSLPLPPGAHLEHHYRRKPFTRDNRHYVSLWECQFVRDGKTLQTLAFIAAAAPQTDTEFKSALDLYSNGNSKNLPVIRLKEETEQPVPLQTETSPSSPTVSTSTSGFGPAQETVVRQGGADSLLNLDTGTGFAPPTDLKSQEESLRWLVRNGIDLSGGNPTFVRELTGVDLVVETRPNDAWDKATAQDLRKSTALAAAPPSQPVRLSVNPDEPVTCAFKTREGSLGLLQVVGFEDVPSGSGPNPPPPGIRIRYKLAQPDATSAAPALAQDTPTSPALQTSMAGVQARMRLIRTKKMRFEYTRTFGRTDGSTGDPTHCVLLAYGGNYREEVQLPDGKKEIHYYFGVPDASDPNHPDSLSTYQGVRANLVGQPGQDGYLEMHDQMFMHWIDSTLAKQWIVGSGWYWKGFPKSGRVRTRTGKPGVLYLKEGRNPEDIYSSEFGWALVEWGDQPYTEFSDFTEIDGVYWPRKIVDDKNSSNEVLLFSKIESNADFDPSVFDLPRPEPNQDIRLSCPIWAANPDGITFDYSKQTNGMYIVHWQDPLPPNYRRWLTVAQAWWRGATYTNGTEMTEYPMPYYDRERDVIVWAQYDEELKKPLKVFEGDQLPASYGPYPWQSLADMVQKWTGKEAPPRPEGDTAVKKPKPLQGQVSQPAGTPSPSPSPAAPTLSQETPTSPALEAALEGIQARMRLIRSKKMQFEYTRTIKKNERMPSDYTEKCVLFTHGGNYLEEAQLENGEKKYRYYFGVPDPDDPLYPNKLHQYEGARFDLEGPESRRVFSSHFYSGDMNGIDCTLVPQWAAPSMGYWPWSRKAGSTHNDPEHPGATFFEVEASSNGADRYSSQLGWARVGDKWPQCSEFTQIEGIYWPRRIVWGDETLLISKIETDFAFDPTRLESPHLEAGWTVKISYPLWKANPGGSIRDPKDAFEGKEILWGKPLSPQEIRILTVAQSRWPGAGTYEYGRGRYPLPYYDKARDVIVWAKYDTNLKQHLKVFEGDQLPESYGPLPWENIALIVQDWIEQFTPDTSEKASKAGTPTTPAKVIEAESGNFPAEYLDQVVAALQKNFVLPPYLRENKTCTVRFKILQNGHLVEPQVVEGQGTGIPGLDQIALNAVLQAGPVPPYPPEYSKKPFVYARVNFRFTPSAP